MEQIRPTQTEEYKGPGKVWSAFGGWGVGAAIAWVATLPFKWSAWKDLLTLKSSSGSKLIKTLVGSGIFVTVASAVGAIIGWNKGKNGQEQHQESQAQLALAANETAHLKQVIAVQEENQKRFTDVIASRKQEGGHTAAAEADKEAAAQAQPKIS